MDEDVFEFVETIITDRSVPRNIREKVQEAIEKMKKNTVTSLSEALYLLDDVSNDINIPEHTRTDVWEIISIIEEEKEKVK